MGWSWRKWLERNFRGGRGESARRPVIRKRKQKSRPVQLYMETLEERTLLTGTWTQLSHNASISVGTMLLLPNGNVVAMDDGGNTPGWVELTPTAAGSYDQGTWSNLASMNGSRLYDGSVVLPSDKVIVYGGEYFNGPQAEANSGQIYDIASNSWTTLPSIPASLDPANSFGDSAMELLPNGNVLAQDQNSPGTFLYNTTSSSWSAGPTTINPGGSQTSSEEGWVKLPGTGGNISNYELEPSLGVLPGYGEYLNSATNTWLGTGGVPVALSEPNENELGPGILLPNGDVFQVGANGSFGGASTNTALYNPTTNLWTAGPAIPATMISDDAPAAILPDGNVIFVADSSQPANPSAQYSPPSDIFEYNYVANTITQLVVPAGLNSQLANDPSFVTRFLVLPNGQVLFTDGSTLWTYSENNAVNSAWTPSVNSIVSNGAGSFTLSGTQLTGMSEGASYGDDAQMATDYPIVQLTNAAGQQFFAETSNWSNPGTVQTGTTVETTQFTMPASAPAPGAYLLTVSANGIASSPILNIQMGGSATNLVLRLDPANTANVQIMNGAAVFAEFPLVDFTSIMVTGDAVGPDTLTVDYTNGNPIPAGGLNYVGNASNNNVLGFKAGFFASETYTPNGANSGVITFPGQTISFANVNTITDLAPTTNAFLNGTGAADQINVVNGPSVGGVQTSEMNSGNNTFAKIDFANKTNVTVNGLTGVDTFTVNNPTPETSLATLNVDSGPSSNVTFNVLTTPVSVTTNILGDGSLTTVNVTSRRQRPGNPRHPQSR